MLSTQYHSKSSTLIHHKQTNPTNQTGKRYISTESMQIAYLVMEKTNTIIKSLVETKEVDLMIMKVVMKMKKNTQTIMEINHMEEIQSIKNLR